MDSERAVKFVLYGWFVGIAVMGVFGFAGDVISTVQDGISKGLPAEKIAANVHTGKRCPVPAVRKAPADGGARPVKSQAAAADGFFRPAQTVRITACAVRFA